MMYEKFFLLRRDKEDGHDFCPHNLRCNKEEALKTIKKF